MPQPEHKLYRNNQQLLKSDSLNIFYLVIKAIHVESLAEPGYKINKFYFSRNLLFFLV
jgi:hypothetical protein